MHKLRTKNNLCIFFFLFLLSFSTILHAENMPPQTETQEIFSDGEILFLGSNTFQDISYVKKALERTGVMKRFLPDSESYERLQFKIQYAGSKESFEEDLRGIAADRFSVEVSQEGKGKSFFTLRKIR
ncbi:MAG: hypothetical protein COV43_06980 [Deltaproteobacteria bacterium CG11_big_fil_rev_8_21_14_0_20_42_23]|nr:MAG: hypothetical protein COV43_06980 [Deltaproteobacteria bacterium CG11_big_fil_rev_8_21_14_0_20_42_23]PJC63705.1 MAG: hypothetical protein CO021_08065 [Deltaproteobacteria bacterium CG_4_9_14_0_2_um_filter_42_21]